MTIMTIDKKTREPTLTIDSLLGGGYLRLPMSLTIVVVTLRALCQEREKAEPSRDGHRRQDTKKRGSQP